MVWVSHSSALSPSCTGAAPSRAIVPREALKSSWRSRSRPQASPGCSLPAIGLHLCDNRGNVLAHTQSNEQHADERIFMAAGIGRQRHRLNSEPERNACTSLLLPRPIRRITTASAKSSMPCWLLGTRRKTRRRSRAAPHAHRRGRPLVFAASRSIRRSGYLGQSQRRLHRSRPGTRRAR